MSFVKDLTIQPKRYDFTQAMRLLYRFKKLNPNQIELQLKAEAMPTGNPEEIQYFSLKNNKAKLRLAMEALSGAKGVIPNYIFEELLAALHREDHALKDFLDVFNQRHFEIVYRANIKKWLLLEQEQVPDLVGLLDHLANLDTKYDFLQYALLLSKPSRSLGVLNQILNDYFPYSTKVKCKTHERRQLPLDSLTRLGQAEHFNSKIGQGFLIGNTCLAQYNHIQLFITPKTRVEFEEIQADKALASSMLELTQHYLRDNTPISIYLIVKRSYLERPLLSAHAAKAARLGEVDCLAPERNPNETVKILLK
ncbi:type VI secretion system baseplate subunit TssG [Vibrio sp. S4M6]|uniref:type VI secretion system baseplate subunit TssG n=1 Tax=Vibrio sinus TaxID=2946865 RepID=UPI00202ABDB4|nr:type VI secretion system baseplate subunit TssG [Vibrio sinus]MCL9783155.1 type VI secretion system baseplate subunit TssG [Vibrio sinus]